MRSTIRRSGLRIAQLTTASVLLALPTSAVALVATAGDPSAHHAALALRVAPRDVDLGRPVTITGHTAPNTVAETVELQSAPRPGGHWRRLASVRAASATAYRFHVRLHRSGMLRAVAFADGDPLARAATTPTADTVAISPIRPIRVRARVEVHRRERAVPMGAATTIAGRLLPADRGRPVALQAPTRHGWRTLARARTERGGRFALRLRANGGTTRRLRVLFTGDARNARATGGAGGLQTLQPAVASWYVDSGTTACGFHAAHGVASRTLACGTKVDLEYRGRAVTATVDDRGPYVTGRTYDLDQSTASALGFDGVATVYASVR